MAEQETLSQSLQLDLFVLLSPLPPSNYPSLATSGQPFCCFLNEASVVFDSFFSLEFVSRFFSPDELLLPSVPKTVVASVPAASLSTRFHETRVWFPLKVPKRMSRASPRSSWTQASPFSGTHSQGPSWRSHAAILPSHPLLGRSSRPLLAGLWAVALLRVDGRVSRRHGPL